MTLQQIVDGLMASASKESHPVAKGHLHENAGLNRHPESEYLDRRRAAQMIEAWSVKNTAAHKPILSGDDATDSCEYPKCLLVGSRLRKS